MKMQTPSNIKDIDLKIQKYVQWDMLYPVAIGSFHGTGDLSVC